MDRHQKRDPVELCTQLDKLRLPETHPLKLNMAENEGTFEQLV